MTFTTSLERIHARVVGGYSVPNDPFILEDLQELLDIMELLRRALKYYANGGWNVQMATEALKEINGND